MPSSRCSRITVAAALATAGLIVVTPVAPPSLPNVGSPAVQLTATDFPLISPTELFTATSANLQGLATEILANPTPILTQILANLTGYAQDLSTGLANAGTGLTTFLNGLPAVLDTALTQLQSGDLFDAGQSVFNYVLLGALLDVGLPFLEATSKVGTAIGGHLDSLLTTLTGALGPVTEILIGSLYGPGNAFNATTAVGQNIIDALGSGDYTAVLTNLEDAPSTIIGAYLNGYPQGQLSPLGYLTNPTSTVDPQGFGGIENILLAEQSIAEALGAAPTSSAADAGAVGTDLSTLGSSLMADLSAVDPSLATDLSGILADLASLF